MLSLSVSVPLSLSFSLCPALPTWLHIRIALTRAQSANRKQEEPEPREGEGSNDANCSCWNLLPYTALTTLVASMCKCPVPSVTPLSVQLPPTLCGVPYQRHKLLRSKIFDFISNAVSSLTFCSKNQRERESFSSSSGSQGANYLSHSLPFCLPLCLWFNRFLWLTLCEFLTCRTVLFEHQLRVCACVCLCLGQRKEELPPCVALQRALQATRLLRLLLLLLVLQHRVHFKLLRKINLVKVFPEQKQQQQQHFPLMWTFPKSFSHSKVNEPAKGV